MLEGSYRKGLKETDKHSFQSKRGLSLLLSLGLLWGGSTAWPARSPDLTCLDLFLRGFMKSMVYETGIDSEEDLVVCIVSAAAEIRETPGIFGRVRQSKARRCTVRLDVN